MLQADPSSYQAHLGAGVVLDLDGKYDDARKHFAKAIEVAPPESKAQAMRNMAFSYAFELKAADAARYEQPLYDEAIAGKNFFAAGESADELARIYLESDDLDNAQKWYAMGHEAGLKQSPTSSPPALTCGISAGSTRRPASPPVAARRRRPEARRRRQGHPRQGHQPAAGAVFPLP